MLDERNLKRAALAWFSVVALMGIIMLGRLVIDLMNML